MRGAWIEIYTFLNTGSLTGTSLPMRGAWIEIQPVVRPKTLYIVAPHAGGVDRNAGWGGCLAAAHKGRSPCGGRG